MVVVRRQQGFSLLELTIVVVLIGLIAAWGIKHYIDALDRARATSVEMSAWRFAQTASIIHAWRNIPANISHHSHGTDNRGVQWVKLGGARIYLNENGWPANADLQLSPSVEDQTAEECQQLLNAMFETPTDAVDAATQKRGNEYEVFAIDGGRACRYQLARNREEAWFFDYYPETGRVSVNAPQFRIEQNAGN